MKLPGFTAEATLGSGGHYRECAQHTAAPNQRVEAQMHWGAFKRDHCTDIGRRQYSAILWDIPAGMDWKEACETTPGSPAGIEPRPPDRCNWSFFQQWGEWDVPVPAGSDCPRWVETDRWCFGKGKGTVAATLHDIPAGMDWHVACERTPGIGDRPPDACLTIMDFPFITRMEGQWLEVPMPNC